MTRFFLAILFVLAAVTGAGAAFPTTPVLDDFNRANENPLASAGTPWGVRIAAGCSGTEGGNPRCTFKLESNAIKDDSANDGEGPGSAYRDDQNYGPGSEAYITLTTLWSAAGSDLWLWLDGNAEETAGMDGYVFYTYYNGGSWYYYTVRRDNNVGTDLLAGDLGPTLASGDAVGAEHNGGTLTWYRKPSGGSWAAMSDVATVSDSTYTSGHIGLSKGFADTTSVLDDFGGGTITATTAVRRLMLMGVGQ